MLRKLSGYMTRLFDRSSGDALPVPHIHSREHHPISRKQFSRAALDVLYGLHKAGFDAYLVGGCLRDILTGGVPKDFDVVTNARPEEVQKLFRRCRIIGRRFKIVHVYFGRDVIEVATFRALVSEEDDRKKVSDEGMILRDNVYGSIEEDALRRDFTANALYYNIGNFALYDFVDSLKDIEARQLRMIGDPETRYREDPVRMIRAARFAAKLDFDLEPATEKPIHELGTTLYSVPAARLFDEVLKLFLSGHARASLSRIQQLSLMEVLFPDTRRALHDSAQKDVWQRLFEQACDNTDRRIAQDKPVTPAFLYAVFLWPDVQARKAELVANGMPPAPAMNKAASQSLQEQIQVTSIPKRFSTVMREIWDLQARLEKIQPRRAERLVTHPRFRAAYDFLLLREQAGELKPGAGDWWTRYQEADGSARQELLNQSPPSGKRKPRRRRRKRKPASDQAND